MSRLGWTVLGTLVAGTAGCLLYTDPINKAPHLEGVVADRAPIVRRERVAFAVTASDAEQDRSEISLAWGWRRGDCPSEEQARTAELRGGPSLALTPDFLGPFCVFVVGTDGHGATGFAAGRFEVLNRPPTAQVEVLRGKPVEPELFELYSDFRLAARVGDPDGDTPEVIWRLHRPGRAAEPAPPCKEPPAGEICFRAEVPGPYRVELEVSDGHDGGTAVVTRTLTVAEDRPPCIRQVLPSLSRFVRLHGERVELAVVQVDDDGAPFERGGRDAPSAAFRWSWRRGTSGPFLRPGGTLHLPEFGFPADYFRPGDTVQVRVRYHDGVERDLSSCERADVALCELRPGSGCYQWVTWTIDFL